MILTIKLRPPAVAIWHPHISQLVVALAWSQDPESYTGGSIATGRVSQAGQVKGDDPDKERYPGLPGWGLSVGLTALPRKKPICYGYFTTASDGGMW
jgi:hypothetical protein